MLRGFLTVSAGLSLLLVSQLAWAHATPLQYSPEASSALKQSPPTVSIAFSERLEPHASSIRVFASDGTSVSTQEAFVDKHSPRNIILPLPTLPSGIYTVSWQLVSADDGHFSRGAYVFSVGKPTSASSSSGTFFELVHRSGWPEAIAIWLELLGEAVLFGILAMGFLLKLAHRGEDERRKMRTIVIACALTILAGTISYLVFKSIFLSKDAGKPLAEAASVFLRTTAGRFTLYRLLCAVIACVLLYRTLATWSGKTTLKTWMCFVLLLCIVLLRVRVSHAMSAQFPAISIPVNTVHLLSKELWIGLLAAAVLLLRFLTTRDLLRISNLLLLSLTLGAASGAYIIWVHLKHPFNFFVTHWGGYCIALIAYGAVLFGLRLYQQTSFLPALVRSNVGKATKSESQFAEGTADLLIIELCVALGTLLYSSLLIITTPPLASTYDFGQQQETALATVTFSEHRFEQDKFLITVMRKEGTQKTGSMSVSMENAERDVGPLVPEITERFAGGYVLDEKTVSLPEKWTVSVTEHETATSDVTARFTIDEPRKKNSWKFPASVAAAAVVLITIAWMLLKKNRSLEQELDNESPLLRWHKPKEALLFGVTATVLIGTTLGTHNHGDGSFRKECIKGGGTWIENVPIREGIITSNQPVLGCSIQFGEKRFHFGDQREFQFEKNRSA